MSSLKSQLEKLSLPQIQNALSLDTRRISLLFDSKEAANLDKEYLFDLGTNGLEEMLNIDKKFEKYEKMLFSRNYINFDRILQTKELNKKLDKLIRQFFIDISPYFLLKPAQKMLEWLVYRYHIHLFNVDDWLMTILAFHNTPMFVRVLSILILDKPSSKWHWLNQSAKSGIPIPRQVLINQCQKNSGFFRSICNLVWLYEKNLSVTDYQHHHLAVSMVTIVVLGILKDAYNVNEENMCIILSLVSRGIISSIPGLKASSLMMLTRFVHVVSLKSDELTNLATLLVKNIQDNLYVESIYCLSIIISKPQMLESSKHIVIKLWNIDDEVIGKLNEISEIFDISNLLKIIKTVKNLETLDHLIVDEDAIKIKSFEERLTDGEFKDVAKIKEMSLVERENLLGLLGSKDKKIVISILDLKKDLLDLVDISKLTEILLDLTRHLLQSNKWTKVISKAIQILCLIDNRVKNPKIIFFFFSIITSGFSRAEFKEFSLFIFNNSRIGKCCDELDVIMNFFNKEISYESYLQYMVMLIGCTDDLIREMIDIISVFKWDDSHFEFKCFLILSCVNQFPNLTLKHGFSDLKMIKSVLHIFSSFKYKKCHEINNLNNEEFIHKLFNCKPEDISIDLPYNFIFSLIKRVTNKDDIDLVIDDILGLAINTLDPSLRQSETVFMINQNLKEGYLIEKLFEFLTPDFEIGIFQTNCCLWIQKIISNDPSIIFNNIVNFLQILILLGHPNQHIRKHSCEMLNYLKTDTVDGGDVNAAAIFSNILKYKEEIISDKIYISMTLENVFTVLNEKDLNQFLGNIFIQLTSDDLSLNLVYSILQMFYYCSLKKFLCQINKIGEKTLNNLKNNSEIQSTNLVSINSKILEIIVELLLKNYDVSNDLNLKLLFQIYDEYIQESTNMIFFNMASHATSQIVKHFDALSNVDLQKKLVTYLIDSIIVTLSGDQNNIFGNFLKQIKLESKYISHELDLDVQICDEPPAKTKRLNRPISEKIKRIIIILESLQNKHKYSDHKEIAQLLFSLLSKLVTLEDVDADYCRLLTLTSLHFVFKAANKKHINFTQDILNIEAIVQCMHMHSTSPQTQQQIILLLTDLIPLFPEYMLHNIVSVFTFMGSVIFQRDDVYTLQTITKIIDVIVESLLKGKVEHSEDIRTKILEVLHIFVDMRDHIPSHRCTPLFLHLLKKMDTTDTLFYLPILIVQNSVKKVSFKGTEMEIAHVYDSQTSFMANCLEFIVGLFIEMKIDDQIESLIMISNFISQLFILHKRDKIDSKINKSLEILDPCTLSSSRLRRSILFNLSKLIIMILSTRELITTVLELAESGSGDILEKKFESLVKHCVCVLIDISEYQFKISRKKIDGQENEFKFLPQLLKAFSSILEKVNYLLSTNCFLEIIKSLILHENSKIKLKALELLSSKLLQVDSNKLTPNEVDKFLLLLPQLLNCIDDNTNIDDNVKSEASVKQMCLFNVKLLSRIIGSNRPMAFLPAFSATTKILTENNVQNVSLLNSTMLCIAELATTFKTYSLPYLHKFMPSLLKFFNQEDTLNSELSMICLVTSLNKIVTSLAEFLSPFIQDLIIQICKIKAKSNKDLYEILHKSTVLEKITLLSNAISSKINCRVFLPNCLKAFKDLVKSDQVSTKYIFVLLKNHLEMMKKDEVETNIKIISEIFIFSMDLRNLCNELIQEKILEIEIAFIESFLCLVILLSENSFRPIFYKLCDFGSEKKDSILTIYHLMNSLSEKLKSIFNLFSSHLVKNAIKQLDENNSSKHECSDSEEAIYKRNFLLKNVLGMLEKCFLYDNENQFTNSSINLLYLPIVDQLENMSGGNDAYKTRCLSEVIPCIVEMMAASSDNSHLQLINYQVCLKTRHTKPMVRFSALRAIEEIVKRMGNMYEALLPETATFISEALEDDCEEVEQECRKVKKTLEHLLGDMTKFF